MMLIQQKITSSFSKKFWAGIASVFLLVAICLPLLSLAKDDGGGLIRCGNSTSTSPTGQIVLTQPCNFEYFIKTINGIISWLIGLAGVIFTIMAVWGGYLYMTSGDNESNKGKARDMLFNTLKGFVIMLLAWLIVHTILDYLVEGPYKNSIFKYIGGSK